MTVCSNWWGCFSCWSAKIWSISTSKSFALSIYELSQTKVWSAEGHTRYRIKTSRDSQQYIVRGELCQLSELPHDYPWFRRWWHAQVDWARLPESEDLWNITDEHNRQSSFDLTRNNRRNMRQKCEGKRERGTEGKSNEPSITASKHLSSHVMTTSAVSVVSCQRSGAVLIFLFRSSIPSNPFAVYLYWESRQLAKSGKYKGTSGAYSRSSLDLRSWYMCS